MLKSKTCESVADLGVHLKGLRGDDAMWHKFQKDHPKEYCKLIEARSDLYRACEKLDKVSRYIDGK